MARRVSGACLSVGNEVPHVKLVRHIEKKVPIKTEIKIEGLATLEARLRALPKGVGGNQLRTAVRAGMANKVVEDAKMRAPVKSGRLRNAITKKIIGASFRDNFTRVGDSFEGYHVGVNLGRSRKDQAGAWYWWFVENGTEGAIAGQNRRGGAGKATNTKKRVLYDHETGTVFGTHADGQPAKPFLRPAIEENRFELVQSFAKEFDRVLTFAEKKAKRLNLG